MNSSAITAKFDAFIDKKYFLIDKRTKLLIVIAALLIPSALFYFLLFKPQMEKIEALQKQVETVKEEVKKARKIAADLPRYKKEFEEVQKEFEATAILLPKTQEIPNLLRNISDLGKSAGLDFLKFVPGVEIPKDFYAEIPIDITITGPYHNLGFFLDKVSKLDRIVTVNNINIDKSQKDGLEMLLNSTCRLVTYRFTNVKLQPPKDGKAK
ncbi:MAG: type 4a pilus biogenesis protein PilO [Chlorobium sp.]|jgi:type IV pilus assembly protein PilO|nr:type 4a pilus biogenesis protein PilO [Chlorobium sp.]